MDSNPMEHSRSVDYKTTESKSQTDISKMRDLLEEETNLYTKGVKDTDVDWFIRDSKIDPTLPIPPTTNSTPSEKSETKPNDDSFTISHSPTHHSVSSSLNSNISNTNDNFVTKTRPSIAPIQEENINSNQIPDHKHSSQRSNTSSGGLFSKLKNKFHKESQFDSHIPKPIQQGVFKENYDMKTRNNLPPEKIDNIRANDNHLQRTMSSPIYSKDTVDPRLEDYIKFYKQKDRRLSTTSRRSSIVSNEDDQDSSSSKITSFLKRKASVSKTTNDQGSTLTKVTSPTPSMNSATTPSISGVELNPSFKGLKPLKRVAFHSSTFLIDPPQQIPSRNPRKGNVEILPNGTVKINPLTEEDKLAIEKSQLGMGGGIVVGGTGALGFIKKDEQDHPHQAPDLESQSDPDEDEPAISQRARNVSIDKPMVHHRPVDYTVPVKKMALDTMYSRCCHLREILPIPAILKQIPKGSLATLPVLQLRNPSPTMIEIQTFADFLRIAPVICVSLDGVSLSVEQFKILLSSMSAKKQLEKLSLRNTPLNEEGWSLLCWFLSRNTVLNKLDITQCPSLTVNVLKKKKKKIEEENKKYNEPMVRMTCNNDNRSDVDWSLFVATLVARGGIDELILTGCCITDIEIFSKLIKLAVSKRTSRLGLAFNQLTPKHLKIIVDNWLFRDFARGLDLGYNDFSSIQMLKILLDFAKRPDFNEIVQNSTISFLSLNSTNSIYSDLFKQVFENVFLKLPNLKYLDFSNNQKLFGIGSHLELNIVQYFTSKLPLFPKLIRLHLENENFSPSSILEFATILPVCKNLGYFSVVGSKIDLTCASALVNAVKNSKTLINLDCDSEEFPNLFKERIGLYTMRNMERLLYASKKPDVSIPSIEASESLTEQLNEILQLKSQQKLDLLSQKVTKFISKAQSIRSDLKLMIDELLKLQLKNELDLDGKETLIRFIFIDSSIEKGLQLIDPSLINKNNSSMANLYLVKVGEGDDTRLANEFTQPASAEDNVEFNHPEVPISHSPLAMSRSDSRTSLSNLDKQEGSVLKLSRLKDFHGPNRPYTELSGEELRQKLMSIELSDLDKIIEYLGKLKNQGISLEQVFNNKNTSHQEQDHDFLNIEEIKSKLKNLSSEANQLPNIEQPPTEIENNSYELSDTYNQVLHNLSNLNK
ncbi:unnamed protein product [Candida verbasci]|uniref:Uncharacterized protein n=1 Tax=Candida verbasci TaxID=1227364 RepID=A0A9W4X828_9ASCO|nr:unnamed protein product [Candida verbasci]